MDQRIKQLWVAALPSGAYLQGIGKLRSETPLSGRQAYCCLGVLCDLHAKETGGTWDDADRYVGRLGVLPPVVMEWAALCDQGNEVRIEATTLTAENDSGRTFREIAYAIERYL